MADGRKGRRIKKSPPLSEDQILVWADAHLARHGVWPNAKSGPVDFRPGENWSLINKALSKGHRSLNTSTTLALLLESRRGVPRHKDLPALTTDQILQWADLHFEKHGAYPIATDGPIEAALTDTWSSVDAALNKGYRGLPGKSTLSRLLHQERGKFHPSTLPKLSEEQILEWMDEHHARTGEWPTKDSGPVQACPSEHWLAIDGNLYKGLRGLPGKTSLARLAIQHRGRIDKRAYTPLTTDAIGEWMQAHTARTGAYPNRRTGTVTDAESEKWDLLERALVAGYRGLPGGQSLRQLREDLISQGKLPDLPRRYSGPAKPAPLNMVKIAALIQTYAARHGQYPIRKSGDVDGAPRDTWTSIEDALINGRRGLPGGQNLATVRRDLISQGRLPEFPVACKNPSTITQEQIDTWVKTYISRRKK